jgi:hypothetical protein
MKTLLIISTGRCVWDDMKKVDSLLPGKEYDTLAVNHMIMYWPGKLTYAASWHSDAVKMFLDIRMYKSRLNRPITYSPKPCKGIDFAVRLKEYKLEVSGVSGAYATGIGCHLCYDKIILAGMPYDNSGYFYTDTNVRKTDYNYNYPNNKGWDNLKDRFGDKIRAVSGNLIECFGELTEEWLNKE